MTALPVIGVAPRPLTEQAPRRKGRALASTDAMASSLLAPERRAAGAVRGEAQCLTLLTLSTTTPITISAVPISLRAADDSPSARMPMMVIAAVPTPDQTA